MRNYYKLAAFACLGLSLSTQTIHAQVADFENLTLPAESFWDGSDLSGVTSPTAFTTNFISGDGLFTNVWDTTYGAPGYWSVGFAQSTNTDSTTSGSGNLFSTRAGSGYNSLTYLVAQNNTELSFQNSSTDTTVQGFYISNSTYTANSMRDGDMFAKQFGGVTGDDADWFMITIAGIDDNDDPTGDSVNFYLADYRFIDNTQDYIVEDWRFVDLSSLGTVSGLSFSLSSSDVGGWGMNTPAFFCIDNIYPADSTNLIDFEDLGFTTIDSVFNGDDFSGEPNDKTYHSTFTDGLASFNNVFNTSYGGYWQSGFAYSNITDNTTSGAGNKYSAIAGAGADNSSNYVISQNGNSIKFNNPSNYDFLEFDITNSTYAHNSMRDGDMFAKQFGGATGDDPDWFKVTIKYYGNNIYIDSLDHYLADYRFSTNSQDVIQTDWENVAFYANGTTIDSIYFELSSSDVGAWGMNTPAFFCLDNITLEFLTSTPELALEVFSFYPNPASSVVNIKNETLIANISITDLNGRVVIANSTINNRITSINVANLNAGIYFIQLMDENGLVSTQKFVKQ